MKKMWALVLAACLMLSVSGCSNTTQTTDETASTGGKLTAGTYTASAQGMNGLVEVSVTVSDSAIESVEVTSDEETPGIGGVLIDGEMEGEIPVVSIPKKIVEQQTLAVDMVSGATITSSAVLTAVKDCMTQAGADVENEWNTPYEPAALESNEETADVIVVGGGGAGLAAAISAAQNGASVIVIEKNGAVGGDTLVCGAIYNNPDEALQSQVEMSDAVKKTVEDALAVTPVSDEHAALQAEVKEEWEAYKASGKTTLFDSDNWFELQTYQGGDNVADLDLVEVLTHQATPGYEWIQSLGMEFEDKISQGAGSLWQRTHTSVMPMGTGFISTYMEAINDGLDVKVVTSMTGKSLLQGEDGTVNGVTAVDKYGNEVTYHANKGVVLATGGFAANSEMIEEYNTSGKWDATDLTKVMTTNRVSSSQGDGIAMALEVGAGLTDMEQIQLLYLGNVKNGQLTKYPPRCVNGTSQEIFINKNGERFVREDGRRDEICLEVLQQPDSMFYFLESADGDYTDIATAKTADGFDFSKMEEEGYIIVADTLDEMAEKLGCDPETLKATVEAYNTAVETGEDEFGRTLFDCKLENGPWVATPRTACLHHTMGGVSIDTEGHVLDAEGNVIPGLVAAGEITGGIHGANRLGGNAVVDTVVFGKLAGETITK